MLFPNKTVPKGLITEDNGVLSIGIPLIIGVLILADVTVAMASVTTKPNLIFVESLLIRFLG